MKDQEWLDIVWGLQKQYLEAVRAHMISKGRDPKTALDSCLIPLTRFLRLIDTKKPAEWLNFHQLLLCVFYCPVLSVQYFNRYKKIMGGSKGGRDQGFFLPLMFPFLIWKFLCLGILVVYISTRLYLLQLQQRKYSDQTKNPLVIRLRKLIKEKSLRALVGELTLIASASVPLWSLSLFLTVLANLPDNPSDSLQTLVTSTVGALFAIVSLSFMGMSLTYHFYRALIR